ncbi:hypothetical protein AQ490_23850 [Wenjunlia vitaminophila]|uniref:OmpR/PhoB-type domain-containing protein n=1 Tax=Wenjunlia vitaminophila TaxID=76728 RepID=A0A0T6LS97_WENVI|nr:BTAD domain-containing putative transcriptional regulator [Wenjunlia vitaminophila]KRV48690.1 hypothetical protein AQ490_23850 [Wenjunlia vitaminophila]
MEFCVLGPLEVRHEGCPLPLGAPRTRAVLAILLATPGRLVAVDQFVDELWPQQPPPDARALVYGYVSRLRRALRPAGPDTARRLVTRRPGYLLDVSDEELDLHRYQRLLAQARLAQQAGHPEHCVTLLGRAERLWRGQPLADVPPTPTVTATTARLQELRLAALEDRFDTALAIGEHAGLVAELTELVAAHPLRERLVGQLMLALHRAGRTAHALHAYQRLRQRLADDLGIDPGPDLRELELAILRGQVDAPASLPPGPTPPRGAGATATTTGAGRPRTTPVATAPTSPTDPVRPSRADGRGPALRSAPADARGTASGPTRSAPTRSAPAGAGPVGPERDGATTRGPEQATPDPEAATVLPPPAQLPADLASFTGRGPELAQLLRYRDIEGPTAVVIHAIDGMAGVGKSSLALRAGHRLAPHFPDGQLFIDLHGFAEGMAPVDPADALNTLLRGLGVPGEHVPHGVAERSALFRSLLANRRALLVLDNAATEDQVRPLLPGAPGCLVLITSRNRLTGLDDARPLSMDVLPMSDAVALLTTVLGQERLVGESPELLEEVARLCGRLPLALRIVANRMRSRPAWTLAHLCERLGDQEQRLAELEAGDRGVAAAFQLSYRQLTGPQRRLFRLLGLHPGPDIDVWAAAALLETGRAETGRLLEALVDAHLLRSSQPGRFHFHDLLRRHAAETAQREESPAERHAALGRLLDHYVHTASVAMDVMAPHGRHRRPRIAPPRSGCPPMAGLSEALAVLDAERCNLLAAADLGVRLGHQHHVSHLSTILGRYLQARSLNSEALTLHRQALLAARCNEDLAGESRALFELGLVQVRLARFGEALASLSRSLVLVRRTGDRSQEVATLCAVGIAGHWLGQRREALAHLRTALDLVRQYDNAPDRAAVLKDLARIEAGLGHLDEARQHLEQALTVFRELDNPWGTHRALNELAHVTRMQGQPEAALRTHRQVLSFTREAGDHDLEIPALDGVGRALRACGELEQALVHHRTALARATQIHRSAHQARAHAAIAEIEDSRGRREVALRHWERALDLYRDLGMPEADEVGARLRAAGRLPVEHPR